MNLGALKYIALLLSFTVCLSSNETNAQQPGQQQARQQQTQNAQNQNVQQLNRKQTDRLAQLGGQRPSQPVRPNFQLSAEEQQYLGQALDYWQQQSEGIKLYQCTFNRYVYDTGLTNHRDPKSGQLSADSVAVGEIRYASPGKASYETTSLFKFDGPGKEYKPISDNKLREKWVTDGDTIYEFDFQQKRLYETKLPMDMRGEGAITNSPIPFMFGAKKAQILSRYWVRVITPPNAKDEVWLEAWPKRAEDAQNYKKVEIILSMEPFLPKAVHMYMPQYDPKKNNYSSVYIAFSDQTVNDRLSKFRDFLGNFVRPGLPTFETGWKRVDRQQMNATAAGASPNQQQK
jgi:TIGR03009 family protein